MNKKKRSILSYILTFVIPIVVFFVTSIIYNLDIIFCIEIYTLIQLFVAFIAFSNDLMQPFSFFYINIFLGFLDIIFVATGLRNVNSVYDMTIYRKSLLIIIIWILFFCLGYFLKKSKCKKQTIVLNKLYIQKKDTNFLKLLLTISIILQLYLIIQIVPRVISYGGIASDFSLFEGQAYMMALFYFCGFIPLLLYELGYKKISYISVVLIFILIAMTGRRVLSISISLFPIFVYYNTKVKKIKFHTLFLLAIPMLLFVVIIGSLRKQTIYEKSDNFLVNMLVTASKYVQYGENIPDMLYAFDSNQIQFQKTKYLTNGITGLIPRSIWEYKPDVDYSIITSKIVYGYDKKYGQPVGPFGWGYFCFGYIGVIFSGLFTGIICKKAYSHMKQKKDAISIGLYAILMLNLINVFAPDAQLKIIFITGVTLLVKLVNNIIFRIKYEKNYYKI